MLEDFLMDQMEDPLVGFDDQRQMLMGEVMLSHEADGTTTNFMDSESVTGQGFLVTFSTDLKALIMSRGGLKVTSPGHLKDLLSGDEYQ